MQPSTRRHLRRIIGSIAIALLTTTCHKRDRASTTTSSSAIEPAATTASSNAAAAAPPPEMRDPVITFSDVGLAEPSAIVHDEKADQYIVSNVDGDPAGSDRNGFISKLLPDGTKLLLKWIQGGKNGVALNAPKGMAIRDEELYVADLDAVRIFHRETGAPRGEVKIVGSKFLNGVSLAPDGRILVTDAGLEASIKGTLEPSGTDAVYAIDKERKVSVASKKRLGGPTGLLPLTNKLWVVSFGSGELYSIDALGNVSETQKLPGGSLDGIVPFGEELLVSSWMASGILRGKPHGTWKVAIGGLRAPGAIAYDRKRRRVVVPLVLDHSVVIYDLE